MDKKQVFARLIYGKSLPRTLIRAAILGGVCYLIFGFCFRPTVLRGKSIKPLSEERVLIENPSAGRWQVLVDSFYSDSDMTGYSYKDLFNNLTSLQVK